MSLVGDYLASIRSTLSFYRQERADGGVRTGIMLGDSTVLGRFDAPEEEYDPSLLWSIDIRCNGPLLPVVAEEAREWFLNQEPTIHEGLSLFAAKLEAGSDPTGAYLLEWTRFPGASPGLTMKAVCGALRRVDALTLALQLRDLQTIWRPILLSLAPIESVTW